MADDKCPECGGEWQDVVFASDDFALVLCTECGGVKILSPEALMAGAAEAQAAASLQ